MTLSPHNGGARWIDNLTVSNPGDLSDGARRAGQGGRAVKPLRIVEQATLVPYWGELHGQSEETIGTNSARAYFTFARDKSGVDVIVHQGNDFQITTPFWEELQRLTREFLDEGAL